MKKYPKKERKKEREKERKVKYTKQTNINFVKN